MADLWWVTCFALGVDAAYGLAIVVLVVARHRNKRMLDELTTVLPLATAATLAWFVGYMVVGPWWALLTAPAILAAACACLLLCAYVREQVARVRVARREAGK